MQILNSRWIWQDHPVVLVGDISKALMIAEDVRQANTMPVKIMMYLFILESKITLFSQLLTDSLENKNIVRNNCYII